MNPRTDDLIALAALGELTADEAAELDAAIAADPGLASELADALASAAALQTSPVEQPPPALRASVLDAIAGVAQDTAQERAASADSDGNSWLETDGTSWVEHDDGTSWLADRAPARRRRFAPLLAAAAALLLVVGGAIVVSNREGGGAEDPIAAVVDADDAVAHSVTGPMGDLEFVYSPAEDAFVLVGEALEPVPAESTYQVWLVADGAPTSLGTFEPDDDGAMEMRADGVDPTGSTIAITVEPVGGSEQPTTQPVAQSAV